LICQVPKLSRYVSIAVCCPGVCEVGFVLELDAALVRQWPNFQWLSNVVGTVFNATR
jgi:hypothetical protein